MRAKELARELRKNQTESESIFWEAVRSSKLGLKIKRQHPINVKMNDTVKTFYADFYCHKKKLIIELDGKVHDNLKERDELRDYLLNILGYKVIRFTNDMVKNSLNNLLEKIKNI